MGALAGMIIFCCLLVVAAGGVLGFVLRGFELLFEIIPGPVGERGLQAVDWLVERIYRILECVLYLGRPPVP